MESIVKSDIFFFITTICIVVLSVVGAVVLIYLVSILRKVSRIATKVEGESNDMLSDVKALRLAIKEEGIHWKHVSRFLRSFFSTATAEPPSRKKKTGASTTKGTITKSE